MADDIYEYETLQEIEYGGLKVIVEAARRDGEGNNIAETYAKKEDIQLTLRPGIDIININGQSIMRSGNINLYNKDEIDTKFNAVRTIQFRIVQSLPESGEPNIIYLVPEEGVSSNGTVLNLYREYIYVDRKWELIGRKEENLNFKTINGENLLITSQDDPTNIVVDSEIHLRVVNELPDIILADRNSLYLKEVNGVYELYGILDTMNWAKLSSAPTDLTAVNNRLTTLESDVADLKVQQPDLSSVESSIDALEDRIETLENAAPAESGGSGSAVTKVSELENDAGYITAAALKKSYTVLETANLNTLDTEGRYKITNAVNYPAGGVASGTFKIEKNGNELEEEWISENIRAYRSASLEDSNPTIVNSLFINGVEYTEENIELTAGYTYEISGSLEGTISIVAGSFEIDDDTTLILSGVKLKNTSTNSTINYLPSTKKLNVVLKKDTKNFIYDIQSNNANTMLTDAAICSNNDLVITGVGGLSIESNNGNHGIKGSEVVIAGNPVIRISALHDCIHASKLAHIQYGKLLLENGNDGIEAENSLSDKGTVMITGGDITIRNTRSTSIHSCLPGIIAGSHTTITLNNNAYPINNCAILEDVTIVGETYQQATFQNYYGTGKVEYQSGTDINDEPVYTELSYNNSYKGYLIGQDLGVEKTIRISGYVAGRIFIAGGSGESNKTDIILDKAYIAHSDANSTITYNPDKSRVAIDCAENTVNYVTQKYAGEINAGLDYDAIKSENNIELSGKGTLIAISYQQDAIDGGQVAFKGNGARYFLDSGLRGIKSSKLYLGGEKISVSGQSYTGGTEDKSVFTNVYAIGNNTTEDLAGSSDIYCRNGKLTAGRYTIFKAFKGIVITGSFRSYSEVPTDDITSAYQNQLSTDNPIYVTTNGTTLSRGITQYTAMDSTDIFNPKTLLFTDWRIFFAVPSVSQLDPSKKYVLGFANGRMNWMDGLDIELPDEVDPIPENALYDENGNVFVDSEGNYLVIGE